MPPRRSNARAVALRHGFKSGLEDTLSDQIARAGQTVRYEKRVIKYVIPERVAKYTPDFELDNGIIIESKGRFLVKDRQKHLLVKEQHPDIDLRFVFSRSKQTISKSSKTTYADWCEKHGFKYADRFIPEEWLKEKN